MSYVDLPPVLPCMNADVKCLDPMIVDASVIRRCNHQHACGSCGLAVCSSPGGCREGRTPSSCACLTASNLAEPALPHKAAAGSVWPMVWFRFYTRQEVAARRRRAAATQQVFVCLLPTLALSEWRLHLTQRLCRLAECMGAQSHWARLCGRHVSCMPAAECRARLWLLMHTVPALVNRPGVYLSRYELLTASSCIPWHCNCWPAGCRWGAAGCGCSAWRGPGHRR
jgi:hypothetical protein